jgi:hypothetical protein
MFSSKTVTRVVGAANPPLSTARGFHCVFASESTAPVRIDCLHLVSNKALLFGLGLLKRSRGRTLQLAIADRRLLLVVAVRDRLPTRTPVSSAAPPPHDALSSLFTAASDIVSLRAPTGRLSCVVR